MFDTVWWSTKAELPVGTDLDNLTTIQEWIGQGSEQVKGERARTALLAVENLSFVYDSYRDVVRPIYVGFDLPTNQVYFIRDSAKRGAYVTAERPVSFVS